MTSTEPREVWLSGMEHIRLAQELIDGVVNDERGTGRTTRLALHYILIALTAPDHKVLVVDHFNSRVAHENLMQLMCRLLDSLNIDYEIGTETKKRLPFLIAKPTKRTI